MPPQPTGQVIERQTARGRIFALRFRAYGRRHFLTLGGAAEGWTREKADAELRYVMADVERGLWAPSTAAPAAAPDTPTFHEFAPEWMEAKTHEVREATVLDYRWQLSNHLLPFFHAHRLPDVTSPRSTATASSRSARARCQPSPSTRRSPASGRPSPSPKSAT